MDAFCLRECHGMTNQEIIGKRFGMLVVENVFRDQGSHVTYVCVCRCDCGELATPLKSNLVSGSTNSCGCFRGHKIKELRSTGSMTCSKCGSKKPESEFWRDKNKYTGRGYSCKQCRGYRYQESCMKSKYGVDREWYKATLESQGGVCAICGSTRPDKSGFKRMFAIDHDHVSGKVRGLLCCECNLGIGQLGDNIGRLRAAIVYLEKQ